MKIGRNAPCPCGSGKKYKKCCLNKTAVPPEKLQYRRLSEVHDKLFPMLVESGETEFGAMAPQVALAEFMAWPDPEDAPDEEAMDRAAHLFWPWYVFNWEYCALDDVDQLISGPEDITITELFLQKIKIDPKSLEGRFLMAANRSPYSFHEIVSVDVGHTVNINDVLTGREVLVQEHSGSEFMQKGDLFFGRVVQVDTVSMFMGLSPNKMPPRMIPEVIQLRRDLSGSRGLLSMDDLYDWDLEIRELFWDMDAMMNQQGEYDDSAPSQEALLSNPEVRNQIEQMLQQHWEDWVDHKIPLLGNKTPRQVIKTKDGRESVEALLKDAEKLSANDPIRSRFEKELINDVRRRLKLDKPVANKRANTDARKMEERIAQTQRQLSEFGAERLPDIYIEYCRDLCDAIAESEALNLHLGRVEIWAAAIVYAIARLNFLFSPETPNCLTTDEICTRFGVKKSTVSNKAITILDILYIFQGDRRFCAPHVTRLFEFIEDEHGFIHPVNVLASEEHSGLEPIPLKPSGQQPVTSKKVHEKNKKQSIHRDDKQLKLFPD